jgi:hypothetical protein
MRFDLPTEVAERLANALLGRFNLYSTAYATGRQIATTTWRLRLMPDNSANDISRRIYQVVWRSLGGVEWWPQLIL